MARLLHFAPEALRRRITRAGLRGAPRNFDIVGAPALQVQEAVFSMPVLEDFQATHQWLREMRRWREGRLVAVHFRIPDDEPVLAGRYGAAKERCSATEAHAALRADPWGREVVVCRPVPPDDIVAIRQVRQDIGWVETPDTAHKYQCVCIMCLPPGSPDLIRRCRAVLNKAVERAHSQANDGDALLQTLAPLDLPLERVGRRLDPRKLISFAQHEHPDVRSQVARLFGYFRADRVTEPCRALLGDPDNTVRSAALESLLRLHGPAWVWAEVRDGGRAVVAELIDLLEFWSHDTATTVLAQIVDAHRGDDLGALAAAALARDEDEPG